MTKTLQLSQSNYIQKVLKQFNIQSSKPALTPTSTRLTNMDSPSTDKGKELNGMIPYASIVGSLMYVMVATQQYLAYVVSVTNHYTSNFGWKHWEVVKNIFQYLCGIEDLQLTFGLDRPIEVKDFTDSDYVGNPNN